MSTASDLLKEHFRIKLVDLLLGNLGPTGRWLLLNPFALLTVSTIGVIVVLIGITLKGSGVGRPPDESTIVDPSSQRPFPLPPTITKGRSVTFSMMAFTVVLLIAYGMYKFYAPTDDLLKSAEVYMECRQFSLPFAVAPHGSADVLVLNKRRDRQEKWGFYTLENTGNVEWTWPKPAFMEEAHLAFDPGGLSGYQCEISNHGPINLFDVTLSFQLNYRDGPIPYAVVVNPLDKDRSFAFYVVNECPEQVAVVFSSSAHARVIGDERWHQLNIEIPHSHSMETLLQFFPTTTKWMTGDPCEGQAPP